MTPKGPDPATLEAFDRFRGCRGYPATVEAMALEADRLIAAKVTEAVKAERERLAGYFDERSKSPVLDDWDRGYITAWRAASRRVAALAESESQPDDGPCHACGGSQIVEVEGVRGWCIWCSPEHQEGPNQ